MTPILPPPPSSLSNRTRSKVPPRLMLSRMSPSHSRPATPLSPPGRRGSGLTATNQENMSPNVDTGESEGTSTWAAFGIGGGGIGVGGFGAGMDDGGSYSPTFASNLDAVDAFGGDDVMSGPAAAAAAAVFGLPSPRRRSSGLDGGAAAGNGNGNSASVRFPSSPKSRPPTSLRDDAVSDAMPNARSPPHSPRLEYRNDFESASDWGGAGGGGGDIGGWMREPVESGMTSLPPVQPPHTPASGGDNNSGGGNNNSNSCGSDSATAGRGGAAAGGGGGGGGRGGETRGRPPIGMSARPPRPAWGSGGAGAASSGGGGGMPPIIPTLPPTPGGGGGGGASLSSPGTPERRRGRVGRRGRSSSPAAPRGGGRATAADGSASDTSAMSSASRPSPRRRSRGRFSSGGCGDGHVTARRGRSRSQNRGVNGGGLPPGDERGRTKSRGRSASRSRDASSSGTPRTSSRSARSRSRHRGDADPTTPRGGGRDGGAMQRRRGRSSSRNSNRGASSSSSSASSSNRSRSLSRSRNDGGGGGRVASSSSQRARSRSASRPRGNGPPLSASAGMARARSRSIGGGMTLNYASDGELGANSSRLPPIPFPGQATRSSSDATGTTARASNRTRSQSADGGHSFPNIGGGSASSGGVGNCGGEGGNNASCVAGAVSSNASSGAALGSSSGGGSSMKRTSSFTNLRERLFGDSVTPEARRSYLPPRMPSVGGGGAGGGGSGGGGGGGAASGWGGSTGNNGAGAPTSSVVGTAQQPEAVFTRTLLTASVYHNQATDLWITTINTNQDPKKTNKSNAARYLKAFSFSTEREARESAYANAPPKMIPFADSPHCFICRGKFALFRRPCHCRNCGVCVCSTCSCTWPSKMIPETYNMKSTKNVKVCKSCNFLAGAFRRALTEGHYDDAVALYNTGNINLRCPFANVKGGGEMMFPIHCAAAGGNLDLLRWLVDIHHCPIKLVRMGNKSKDRGVNEPILTSKGRTVLGIAMSGQSVDILRYLVSEKGMSVHEVKDLKTSLMALEAVLNAFPRNYVDLPVGSDPGLRIDIESTIGGVYRSDAGGDTTDCDDFGSTDGDGTSDDNAGFDGSDEHEEIEEDDSVSTTVADACILCYENSIDCVITPCGHQICCLSCSRNLTACPVCNSEGQFIRIYKP